MADEGSKAPPRAPLRSNSSATSRPQRLVSSALALSQSSTSPDLRDLPTIPSSSRVPSHDHHAAREPFSSANPGATPALRKRPSRLLQVLHLGKNAIESNESSEMHSGNHELTPESRATADLVPVDGGNLVSPKAARLLGMKVNTNDQAKDTGNRLIEGDAQQHDALDPSASKLSPLDKALQLLGIPSSSLRLKKDERSTHSKDVVHGAVAGAGTSSDTSNESNEHGRVALHSQPKHQGRKKKKRARAVQIMGPIEEASHSSLSDPDLLRLTDRTDAHRKRRSLTDSYVVPAYYLTEHDSTAADEYEDCAEDDAERDIKEDIKDDIDTTSIRLQKLQVDDGLQKPHHQEIYTQGASFHETTQSDTNLPPSFAQELPLWQLHLQGPHPQPPHNRHVHLQKAHPHQSRLPTIHSQEDSLVKNEYPVDASSSIPGKFNGKSSLQQMEDDLLRHQELQLAADARRLELDAKVAEMKKRHIQMKDDFEKFRSSLSQGIYDYTREHTEALKEFNAIKQRVSGMNLNEYIGDLSSVTDSTLDGNKKEVKCDRKDDGHDERDNGHDEKDDDHNENDDDDDTASLISIRSSIDLDEEPVVHTARHMTITRVTPGMVKLVDIKPPKKGATVMGQPTAGPSRVVDQSKRNAIVGSASLGLGVQGASRPSKFESSQHERAKEKKAKLPREQSNNMISSWISSTEPTDKRPFSLIDSDVLADQDLDAPPPPPRKNSKHHCVQGGHIFRPINLKTAPDEIEVNRLGVRPYLHTSAGRKQHVHVPVRCEVCGEDVKQELWQCEIPVCSLSVCSACAVDLEEGFEDRAIKSHEKLVN